MVIVGGPPVSWTSGHILDHWGMGMWPVSTGSPNHKKRKQDEEPMRRRSKYEGEALSAWLSRDYLWFCICLVHNIIGSVLPIKIIPCFILQWSAHTVLNPLQTTVKESVSYCEETGQTLSSASRSTNSQGRNPRRRESDAVQTWVKTALHPLILWRVSVAAAAVAVLVWTRQHPRLFGAFKSDLLIVNRY